MQTKYKKRETQKYTNNKQTNAYNNNNTKSKTQHKHKK